MIGIITLLMRLGPDVIEIIKDVVSAISAGNDIRAARAAQEAAFRQATILAAKERLRNQK